MHNRNWLCKFIDMWDPIPHKPGRSCDQVIECLVGSSIPLNKEVDGMSHVCDFKWLAVAKQMFGKCFLWFLEWLTYMVIAKAYFFITVIS